MALTFGPEYLGVNPEDPDNVSVLFLPAEQPANLAADVEVDPLGYVSFTVGESGRYKVVARDAQGLVTTTKIVNLVDFATYDITDHRSYADHAPSVGEGSTHAGGGGGGGVTKHSDLTGLDADDHPQYLTQARGDSRYQASGNYAPATHSHAASQISDSTATGRSVVTATDAAAARTAIGAGTSSLALGTTSSTAKAGNYQPTAANISDSTATGRSVLTATDAAAARSAIGAGTSSLALGTTGSTAKAGNYTPSIADLPAGSTLTVRKSGGTWPARPTTRTDIIVRWVGASPAPSIVADTGTAGMYSVDETSITTS